MIFFSRSLHLPRLVGLLNKNLPLHPILDPDTTARTLQPPLVQNKISLQLKDIQISEALPVSVVAIKAGLPATRTAQHGRGTLYDQLGVLLIILYVMYHCVWKPEPFGHNRVGHRSVPLVIATAN